MINEDLKKKFEKFVYNIYFCRYIKVRGVAQPGLEYASGGRGVGCSNHLTPTLIIKALQGNLVRLFCFSNTIVTLLQGIKVKSHIKYIKACA